MIALASDCLVLQIAGGERIPFSADMIAPEFMGPTARDFAPEVVYHAAKAVFHYFQNELGRQTVTAEEFTQALDKALAGFKLPAPEAPALPVLESDLGRLATEAEAGCELFFFPRLREEFRLQLEHGPRVLRFNGLRGCVMTLAGARRWTARCQSLSEQIVVFLRGCANAQARQQQFSLVIE